MASRLSENDFARLGRIVKAPFRVYSPSAGGGRDYANLIHAGLIEAKDVGDEQETVLLVSATPAGRAALEKRDE